MNKQGCFIKSCRRVRIGTVLTGLVLFICAPCSGAEHNASLGPPAGGNVFAAYSQVNLSRPERSTPLQIVIKRLQSKNFGWQAGQSLEITASVKKSGGRTEELRDINGKNAWRLVLDENGEGVLQIDPAPDCFSGSLAVFADKSLIYADTHPTSTSRGLAVEKVYERCMPDGARIRLTYTDQQLDEAGEHAAFAKDAFKAAIFAYQLISRNKGFNASGYSFANPDADYAFDPERTLDIYIGYSESKGAFFWHGFQSALFKDAPYFDTIRLSEKAYHPVIFLPCNYKDFIRNWQTLNPSPLGARAIQHDLRGTLSHEMLHAMLFYYNKNLNREVVAFQGIAAGQDPVRPKEMDWYVEGLARYFETFAGAKHDFYSEGFRQVLADRIRFSRGGINYFMRYPDQPFLKLRYENAIFWKFMDSQFGMRAIEKLSRQLRGKGEPAQLRQALEAATGLSTEKLLKLFARCAYTKTLGLEREVKYLKDIACTKLVLRGRTFYITDGFGSIKPLGSRCATDWIGGWDRATASLGESSCAGDSTEEADVNGWATDFCSIRIEDAIEKGQELGIVNKSRNALLGVQAIAGDRPEGRIVKDLGSLRAGEKLTLNTVTDLGKTEKQQNAQIVTLLITNLDPNETGKYEILAK